MANYLKMLIDDAVKDFVVINFGEYFKSTRENVLGKLKKCKAQITVVLVLENEEIDDNKSMLKIFYLSGN